MILSAQVALNIEWLKRGPSRENSRNKIDVRYCEEVE